MQRPSNLGGPHGLPGQPFQVLRKSVPDRGLSWLYQVARSVPEARGRRSGVGWGRKEERCCPHEMRQEGKHQCLDIKTDTPLLSRRFTCLQEILTLHHHHH